MAGVAAVQIKSTTYSRDGSLLPMWWSRRKGYVAGVVDFLRFICPMNVWYILPFEALAGRVATVCSGEGRAQVSVVYGGLAFARR